MTKLTPRIIVPSAAEAIPFYVAVFGAREQRRDTDDEGRIVNAELTIGDSTLLLVDEAKHWHNLAPSSLGGTPVLLALELDEVDSVWAKAIAHGAREIFPLADQPYGHRGGRFQDPFGHVWMMYKVLPSFR